MSPALDTIRPKIAPLVRMLSSPNDNEALGAARAIGRVLTGAGLDWHALADFVEAKAVPPFAYTAPADAYTRPAPPQPAPKPQRSPSPWPTYTTLKHSERCAWLDAVERCPLAMEKNKRGEFEELRKKMVCRPHELLSRKEINLFTRLVRTAWIIGVRP